MFLLICVVIATAAFSHQSFCTATESVREMLIRDRGESRAYVGMTPRGMMELWDNPETRSWTVIQTDPYGQSCIILNGRHAGPVLRERGEDM
ncbi:hypothetical protein [Maritimibacter sp. 55A14]|uniref:hypothetical protein n=1 Tax=Maritimibacter sp. 55A14 TaxID=2174844 RepID=UPI0011B26C14|nr:hypothetical protein [Maritimibacter sp. 55A14]